MRIIELDKENWQDYKLRFTYVTDSYYKTAIQKSETGWNIALELSQFPEKITKSFEDKLFQPYWENPSAYGVELENEIVGFLEVEREGWSNRLRITELLVLSGFRGKGCGKALMDKAKALALDERFRAVILETQTCNTKAIGFYLSQGFEFCGMDISCYSNEDVKKNEVRLELVYWL